MSEKLTVTNKVKIGFSFAIVFLLVLATNRFDKQRFDTLEDSLTSVYEDRLVAKGYLYTLNNIFHDQKKYLILENEEYAIDSYHNTVNTLLGSYEATRLTSEEKSIFTNLKTNINRLFELEDRYVLEDKAALSASQKEQLSVHFRRIQQNLDNLATLQQTEGENMVRFAKSSINTSAFMSNLQIVLIIIIGIVVQFIIFYK